MINFRFGRLNLVDLAGSERYMTYSFLLMIQICNLWTMNWDWDSLIWCSQQPVEQAEGFRC